MPLLETLSTSQNGGLDRCDTFGETPSIDYWEEKCTALSTHVTGMNDATARLLAFWAHQMTCWRPISPVRSQWLRQTTISMQSDDLWADCCGPISWLWCEETATWFTHLELIKASFCNKSRSLLAQTTKTEFQILLFEKEEVKNIDPKLDQQLAVDWESKMETKSGVILQNSTQSICKH